MKKTAIVNVDPTMRIVDENGEMITLEAVEKEMIRRAMTCYNGHMTVVAKRLGIGRSTLYRKLEEYGMSPGATQAP